MITWQMPEIMPHKKLGFFSLEIDSGNKTGSFMEKTTWLSLCQALSYFRSKRPQSKT